MTPETTTLLPGKVLVVTSDPVWPGSLLRLSDVPEGANLNSGRIQSYALPAGRVLTFGPYTQATRWQTSSAQGSVSYSFSEPSFYPVGTLAATLANLDHLTANAAFAYDTEEAGYVRWNPVTFSWENVTGTAGAPQSIHGATAITAVLDAAVVSGAVLTLDCPGNGSALGVFWLNGPTAFAFQWLRGGVAIGGATASEYTLAGADVGQQVACRIIASNASGSETITSSALTVS